MSQFQIPVKTGATTIIVGADTFEAVVDLAQLVRDDVARHVSPDAYIRVRHNEDQGVSYYEYYSPGLGAAKKLSKSKAANAKNKDFPHYVGYATPWVRIQYEGPETDERVYYVMYDNLDDMAIDQGFDEPLAWYKAEPAKVGNIYTFLCLEKNPTELAFQQYGSTKTGYVSFQPNAGRTNHENNRAKQLLKKRTA